MPNKRPLIAIAPQREAYTGDDPTYLVRRRYLDYIESFGATPFIMTYGEEGVREQELQLMELADGFMLLGGDLAINPAEYGDKKILSKTSEPPYRPDRDICEQEIVRFAFKNNKPVFGICRGLQIMNVALGGTLYQDMELREDTPKIEVNHFQYENIFEPVHPLQITPGTLMHKILNKNEIRVNSVHRQSVKDIAEGLEVCAIAPDGIVEAVYAPSCNFMLGIQFHPCFIPESDVSIGLGKAFVEACRK